jgi:hypothetical protein
VERNEESLYAVNNAATLRNNYTEAWINGGLIFALWDDLRSQEAFSIAKVMGYNETARDYILQSEPLLMMETKKKPSEFWAGMVVFALFAARHIIPRKK